MAKDNINISELKDALLELSKKSLGNIDLWTQYINENTIDTKIPIDASTSRNISQPFFYHSPIFSRNTDVNKKLKDENSEEFEKVYNLLFKTNLNELSWSEREYKQDINTYPGIVNSYIFRFLLRQLILSEYKVVFKDEIFERAFDELKTFMNSEKIVQKIKFIIAGNIKLNKTINHCNIELRQATEKDKIDFNILYGKTPSQTGLVGNSFILHDSVIIEYTKLINRSFNEIISLKKSEFQIAEKIKNLLLLCQTGNFELIAPIIYSEESTMFLNSFTRTVIDMPTYKIGSHVRKKLNMSDEYYQKLQELIEYKIDEKFENRFKYLYDEILGKNISDNEIQIDRALYRFNKSKSTSILSIEDKIIELMIGMEYILNTESYEVTLQIRYYITQLYQKVLSPKEKLKIESLMKIFYKYRSTVIHGEKQKEMDLQIIKQSEALFLDVLYWVIVLVLKHKLPLKEIQKSLKECLFTGEVLLDALKRNNPSLTITEDNIPLLYTPQI